MYKIITIPCGNVNCYLIEGNNFAILIDTAREKYRKHLLERLENYNIILIILTHGHIDHTGNAAFLAKHFNAKIAMHSDDYKLSKNNSINNIYSNSFVGSILKKVSLWNFKKTSIEEFEPDLFLTDDQSLKEFGIDATIIHIPGHTKGSIGILINDNELIGGDIFMNFLYPSEALIAEDIDMLRKSIKKIELLDLKLVYPGHGREITSVKISF
ncbi:MULTISPECIES: MBL fold metallo-hydrolase [Clostridium]|uniref:MBL fold metallo-hydrolase n=1 Tax=Clostridium cibarium TaxID=2762247 RepID=A0ABR8PQ20_9CLOT|nr:MULTISPECIES: MBL fold metallo-hydrolase [Clostridium]MBD7910164.1 MBL fold metallo-hydrolase [Clostridium cibarium]